MALLILNIVLIALTAVGGGGYAYRRYVSPSGTTVVEEGSPGSSLGAVAGVLLALVILIVLLVYGSNAGWFNSSTNNTITNTNNQGSTSAPGLQTSAPAQSSSSST